MSLPANGTKSKPALSDVEVFIAELKKDYPQFKFKAGKQDFWSPGSKTITYNPESPLRKLQYSLLHELSHALLDHQKYTTDFELLKMETEAWHKATEISPKYGLEINQDHVQNCLDTYRDWLHRRSRCPRCGMHVLQDNQGSYKCFNCQTKWSVTDKRFTRTYRRLFHPAKF
jgi:DNA-directed RNA polymerase subunit RPC12/RpoP